MPNSYVNIPIWLPIPQLHLHQTTHTIIICNSLIRIIRVANQLCSGDDGVKIEAYKCEVCGRVYESIDWDVLFVHCFVEM